MKYLAPPYLHACTSIIFLIAIIFPPYYYELLIGEYNLIYFHPGAILFYFICSLSFLFGYFLTPKINFNASILIRNSSFKLDFTLIFLISFLALYLIYETLRSDELLLDLLLSANGAVIKDELSPVGFGGLFNIFFMAFFWYFYMSYCLGLNFKKKSQKLYFKWFLIFSFALILISSVIKLARGELLPFLLGILFVHVDVNFKRKLKFNFDFMVTVLKYLIILFGIFSLFSLLRGEFDLFKIFSDFVGYVFASYNKLAYIIDNKLNYPYSGTGVYFSSFLSFNESFNNFFGFSGYMGWPKYFDLWNSEFQTVGYSGLNKYLIWPSAMGYLFVDFGWYAFLVFLLYGVLYKFVWLLWVEKTALGIVLYPWFAFCLLFWFGTNYLLDTKLFVFILVGLFISCLNILKGSKNDL